MQVFGCVKTFSLRSCNPLLCVINIFNENSVGSRIVSFKRRVSDDGDLSHLETTNQIYDYIRMLDADNYPCAFIEIDNFRLEFTSAKHVGETVEAVVKFHRRDK